MKHISRIENVDNLRALVRQDLRELGIKVPKIKKSKKATSSKPLQELQGKGGLSLFGNYLSHVPCIHVEGCGYVPKFLVDAAEIICENIEQEGIFRKSGAVSRQKEIKQQLEDGKGFVGASVYDVTALVKQFFRELPEPLFTSVYHDTFIRCFQLDSQEDSRNAVLMLCLLLPGEHISTLRYTLQLLAKTATFSEKNKMDTTNLAVVLAPNIMHVNSKSEKMNSSEEKLLQVQTSVVELLIQNAGSVGMVDEELCERASFMSEIFGTDDELDASEDNLEESKECRRKEKKRKRSGSFQGFVSSIASSITKWRRSTDGKTNVSQVNSASQPGNTSQMSTSSQGRGVTVAGAQSEDNGSQGVYQFSKTDVTPVVRKRKAGEEARAFSASKKKTILKQLPQHTALASTPFTPASGVKRMDINSARRAGVADTPSIQFSRAYSVTPRHNIKTPRKKLGLFSPGSAVKKKRHVSAANLSVQSAGKKTKSKGIFRRLSGSKGSENSQSHQIPPTPTTQIGQRLASPSQTPNGTVTEDTNQRNTSVNRSIKYGPADESPIAAILQNSALSPSFCEQSVMSTCEERMSLNEGFILGDADMSHIMVEDGPGMSRAKQDPGEYVELGTVVRNVVSESDMANQSCDNSVLRNHSRSYSAEGVLDGSLRKNALRRGQPNSIKAGLLHGSEKEVQKLRRSFGLDKSDIGFPELVSAPSFVENSCSIAVIKPESDAVSENEMKSKNDSGEYESIDVDMEEKAAKSPVSVSRYTSETDVKADVKSISEVDLNSRNKLNNTENEGDNESVSGFSTISGGTAIFKEKEVSTVEEVTKDKEELNKRKAESLEDTGMKEKRISMKASESVDSLFSEQSETSPSSVPKEMTRSISADSGKGSMYDEPYTCRSTSPSEVKLRPRKAISTEDLQPPKTPVSVTRSKSLLETSMAQKKSNIRPNLQISAETHKLLARAGYIRDQGSVPGKSDLDISSLGDHDFGMSVIPDCPSALEIKHAELVVPRRESIIELQKAHPGRVMASVRRFDRISEEGENDVTDRHNSPLRFPNSTSRRRGVSPLAMSSVFGKRSTETHKIKELVMLNTDCKLAKGTAKLPISTQLLKPTEKVTNADSAQKTTGSNAVKRKPSIYFSKNESAQNSFEKCKLKSSFRTGIRPIVNISNCSSVCEEMSDSVFEESMDTGDKSSAENVIVDLHENNKSEEAKEKKSGFEGQSIDLNQSLQDTIDRVCTPLSEKIKQNSDRIVKSVEKESKSGTPDNINTSVNNSVLLSETPSLNVEEIRSRAAAGKTPMELIRSSFSPRSPRKPVKRLGSASPKASHHSPRRPPRSPNRVFKSRPIMSMIPSRLDDKVQNENNNSTF